MGESSSASSSPSPSPPPISRSNIPESTPTSDSFSNASEKARQQGKPAANMTKPQSTSRPAPVVHQPTPIKDAVNDAFDQAPNTNELDPDFMKRLTEQVTEQVIKNLQGANLGAPASVPSASPVQSSYDSFPPHFTPPSPIQEHDQRGRRFSTSPERAPSDAGSNFSRESTDSRDTQRSTQSNRESTPRATQAEPTPGLKRSKTTAAGVPEPMPRFDPAARWKGSLPDAIPLRKDSKDSTSSLLDGAGRRSSRPDAVLEEEDADETTLERIWQPLFDNGNPTVRLGQFLRGIAQHIIDDYEPKGSLVVTPYKMLRFLDETKVADELYPWAAIFGGKMSWTSLSMMYRKLTCQHHLVQQLYHEAPTKPSLTPQGFETFMTCLIQAHPDTEFERLANAVRNMPISNADDCKERFPKELSRRLLPANPNMRAEQRLISSLNHEPVLVPLDERASAMPPPPSTAPPQGSFPQRERAPYAHAPQSNTAEDGEYSTSSVPLERERKPYYAKEGSGKRYDPEGESAGRDRDPDRESSTATSRDPSRPGSNKYRSETTSTRTSRQHSGLPPQSMYNKSGPTDTGNAPPQARPRVGTNPNPSSGGSFAKGARRSPPPRGFARSEPADVNSIPASQYASNLHGSARDRYAGDFEDDNGRSYNNAPRRPTERNTNYANGDEVNARPIPPRNAGQSAPAFDSGYASSGGQASSQYGTPRTGGPPAGTPPDHRRSWYPPGAASGGGTDGYGSYMGNGGYGNSSGY